MNKVENFKDFIKQNFDVDISGKDFLELLEKISKYSCKGIMFEIKERKLLWWINKDNSIEKMYDTYIRGIYGGFRDSDPINTPRVYYFDLITSSLNIISIKIVSEPFKKKEERKTTLP